ncbi:outer membrane lipoprotein carrier protein LolA [Prosthecobacter sp.]|uniref:outer membrane lipoprotein carrier protein LolA n=1 Tax=Prosthecobacter sp. TaxID=1965333 RepID=UPI003783E345
MLLAATLGLTPLLQAAPDPSLIPPVMRQWMAVQKDIGSIKVAFQQTRTTPALKQPVTASGRFWRMADGRFRLEIGSPATMILLFDKESVRLKEGTDAPWQSLKADDSRVRVWMKFLSGREMDAESLTNNFTLRVTQQEKDFVTVAMIPRPLLIKKYLKQLDMQIEPGGRRLLGFRVVQGDGSTLLLHFGPPEKLTGDLPQLFQYQ